MRADRVAARSRGNRIVAFTQKSKFGFGLALGLSISLVACASNAPPSPGPTTPAAVSKAESEPEWLSTLNTYRVANGLRPVSEDPALSKADLNHARYLVKNRIGFTAGAKLHDEDEHNPLYTSNGYWAGHSGNVQLTTRKMSQSRSIEAWMGAPFHGLAMIAPDLSTSGFGSYCDDDLCAAVLSTGHLSDLSGVATRKRVQFDYDSDAPGKQNQVVLEAPVRWPAPGVTIANGSFDGHEWPNPLSACPGYVAPTGAVIFASFGRDFVAEVREESLLCDGAAVTHCVVTAKSYVNPDAGEQDHARKALEHDAAVLLIPRRPLSPGSTWTWR